jgi:DNA-binding MarR family transcriptional regulator
MNDVRWLSADEQQAWRALLAATSSVFDGLEHQLMRDAGMPHAYYEILVRLSEADDCRLRMHELAELCNASRSRLSHAVSRLIDAGWVEKVDCPTDRRGSFAVLTDKGFEQLVDAAPGHVEEVHRRLLDPLSCEQVAQLRDICQAIISHGRILDSAATTERCPAAG